MALISHIVQKLIDDKIFVQEGLTSGIISYGSLAKQLKPEVEEELNREVKQRAIVMALRRYAEKLKKANNNMVFDYNSDVILKGHICTISVPKSADILFNILLDIMK